MLGQLVAAGVTGGMPPQMPAMVPIDTPLALSGFTDSTMREFGPFFQQMGIPVVQGGAATSSEFGDQQTCGGMGAFSESR